MSFEEENSMTDMVACSITGEFTTLLFTAKSLLMPSIHLRFGMFSLNHRGHYK